MIEEASIIGLAADFSDLATRAVDLAIAADRRGAHATAQAVAAAIPKLIITLGERAAEEVAKVGGS